MATKTATDSLPNLLNVLRTARADFKAFVDRRINAAEKRSKAVFRLARSLSKRLAPAKTK